MGHYRYTNFNQNRRWSCSGIDDLTWNGPYADWVKQADHAGEFGLRKLWPRGARVEEAYVRSIGSGELGTGRSTQGTQETSSEMELVPGEFWEV